MTYPTPLDPEKFVLMVTGSLLVAGYLWYVFVRKLTSGERAVMVVILVVVALILSIGLLLSLSR